MIIFADALSFLCLILNISLFVQLKPPYSIFLLVVQILAMVFSPVLAVLGLLGTGLGWMYHVPIADGCLLAVRHILEQASISLRERGVVSSRPRLVWQPNPSSTSV